LLLLQFGTCDWLAFVYFTGRQCNGGIGLLVLVLVLVLLFT